MSKERPAIPAINPEVSEAIGRTTIFDALEQADADLEYNKQLEERQKQLEERQKQLEEENGRDYMTGLQNKGPYDRRIENMKRQLGGEGRRHGDKDPHPVVIMAVDAIGLKAINEDKIHGGKKVGDELIMRVANTLKESFPRGSREDIFRDGGDEFTGFFSVPAEKLPRFLQKVTGMALANEEIFRTGIRIAYEGSTELEIDTLIDAADPKKHPENKITAETCPDPEEYIEQLLKA